MPDEVGCDCHKGKPHHTKSYSSNPITRYACEFPRGSSDFFESDFTWASMKFSDADDKVRALLINVLVALLIMFIGCNFT